MHKNGTDTHSGSTRLLLGALLAALLLLRSPGRLLHPQFWAEDGTVFFQDAFNHGFLQTILQPASGYLHSFPRLVAGLSLLFPMEQAPLVFNLAAFVVQLLPALYLLSPRMARVIPSFPARAVAALLYVSLPASVRDPREPHQRPLVPGPDGALHPGGRAGRSGPRSGCSRRS